VRQDHCKMVTYRRCFFVPEERCVRVPYTVCKLVPEEKCQVLRYRRCRLIQEERCCLVPYVVCKMVCEQRIEMVPVTVNCGMEAITMKRPVYRLVPVIEPLEVPCTCPPALPPLPLTRDDGPRGQLAVLPSRFEAVESFSPRLRKISPV